MLNSSFEEVVFQLPNGNCSNPGELPKHITNEPLRFAVHPGKDLPMIAMTSVNYGDLEIMVGRVGNRSRGRRPPRRKPLKVLKSSFILNNTSKLHIQKKKQQTNKQE